MKKQALIPGQLTLWDLEITETPISFTKTEEKSSNKYNSYTEQQSKVIERYKAIDELNRIIHYCGGGVGIELQYIDTYKTIYINRDGKEEFIWNKKLPILPMDKIVYYKNPSTSFNAIQENKLKELLQKTPDAKVIKRRADENIIIEFSDKVISINSLGWVLEFQGCKTVEESDIESQKQVKEASVEDFRKDAKIGDIVEAKHGTIDIRGKIVHIYGPGNVTLNIIFDDGKKHTAIHRSKITKIIKCA